MKRILLATAALAVLAGDVLGQVGSGTPIFWNGSRNDAANLVGTSASSGATITLTPGGSQSAYISEVHITNCSSASTVVATNVLSLTTTNMGGAAWTIAGGNPTAGSCTDQIDTFGNAPLKANAPGAVTFVLPSFNGNQTIRVSVYWYSAP